MINGKTADDMLIGLQHTMQQVHDEIDMTNVPVRQAYGYSGAKTGRWSGNDMKNNMVEPLRTNDMWGNMVEPPLPRPETQVQRDKRVAFTLRCPVCGAEPDRFCTEPLPNKGHSVRNPLAGSKGRRKRVKPMWHPHEGRLTKARLIDDEQGPA